ncbi:MAG: DMT family transporter [Lachnospiraceae bacterium]|nr:DMT family transporter [Lachnospiraceae bacterium]
MEKKGNTSLKGVLILFTAAIIWGASFVAQSVGMEKVDAFTYNGVRTIMGALFLLPVVLIRNHKAKKVSAGENAGKGSKESDIKQNRTDSKASDIKQNRTDSQASDNRNNTTNGIFSKKALKYGFILGIAFCLASNFQQFAFYYSTAGKIAFINALYIFFVPIIGIFLKKKIPFLTWLCVILGFIGLYFITIKQGQIEEINKGDILALICAFFYGVHILYIEKFAQEVDGVLLSCLQFFVGGIISIILMFIFETPVVADILSAYKPLLYSGIMSCGIAYTLQIIGQKYTEATIASLILSTESVFAVISSALLLHEYLTPRETLGCSIVFFAIILSQLPIPNKLKKR